MNLHHVVVSLACALGALALSAAPVPAQSSGGGLGVFGAETATAAPTAEGEAGEAPAGEAGPTLMGSPFQLEADVNNLTIVEGAVTAMNARGNVRLQTDEVIITGVRLIYSEVEQLMRAFGDETQRCIVVQEGTVIHCDEFYYNVETGEKEPRGNPKIFLRREGAEDIEMEGDQITFVEASEDKPGEVRMMGRTRIGTAGFQSRTKFDDRTNAPILGDEKLTPTTMDSPAAREALAPQKADDTPTRP